MPERVTAAKPDTFGEEATMDTQLLLCCALATAGKRVFVPGCGRGYDLVALLAAGAEEAVGLELAPTAVSQRYDCLRRLALHLRGWGQAAEAVRLGL